MIKLVNFLIRGVDEGYFWSQVDPKYLKRVGFIAREFIYDTVICHVVIDYTLEKIVQATVAFSLPLEHALSFIDLGVKNTAALEK